LTSVGNRRAQASLNPTRCAICGVEGEADELYPARLNLDALTPAVFSARRLPDRVHYRMVRCSRCGLVRSDPVLNHELMVDLYRASTFDYADELEGLRVTYGEALRRVAATVATRRGLLDIGCGNGFVLELAVEQGWDGVRGVEPSADAIAQAPEGLGSLIVHDVMRPGLFAPDSFDAVTLFQVLDHIPDPVALLHECHRVLRPGGAILALNHNVSAWSARALGERSPIVDVEHTYLYSPDTMRRIFEQAGFSVVSVGAVRNTYSIAYLLHLMPLPRGLKTSLVPWFRRAWPGRVHLTVPLGNLGLLARRAT
jgi:SAM-dependent methyltransferase